MDKNFRAGVVSVTLRQYAFENFIRRVKLTDLSCIEWGSDIHVPYDDPDKAVQVSAKMVINNLSTASYGSYYRLGWLHEKNLFSMIIETAKFLCAPMIRVWGGGIGSKYLNSKMRREITDDALNIAALARKHDMKVSLEYHKDSITDTAESALKFIKEVRGWGADNIYLYWQANPDMGFSGNKQELLKILPYLSNVHVLAQEGNMRLALSEHRARWKEYIKIIKDSGGKHDFLIEFVCGDDEKFLIEDAHILVDLLENA